MNMDSVLNGEYLEYFIIGTHTSIWIALLISWILDLPLSRLTNINVLLGVLLIPFIYILGLLMDSVSQLLLRPLRRIIHKLAHDITGISDNSSDISQSDEFIAAYSPVLYAGYDWRMRRSKVVGSAIFNWIMLGLVILSQLDTPGSYNSIVVEIASIVLIALSVFSWVDLTFRAYTYRRKAFEIIQLQSNQHIVE